MVEIEHVRFNNGAYQPILGESVRGKFVVLISTLFPDPLTKWAELLVLLETIKYSNAKFIMLVTPYNPLARSDKKDQPHIGIIFRAFAVSVETYINSILFCDLHSDITQGFFRVRSDCITARDLLFDYVKKNLNVQAMLSLDAGSMRRTQKMAKSLGGIPYGLMDKFRDDNDDSADAYAIFGIKPKDKSICSVEDECCTVSSVETADNLLADSDASDFNVVCSHGAFSGKALERILSARRLSKIITTNTVPLDSIRETLVNAGKLVILDMSKKFSDAILSIFIDRPMGKLFDYGKVYSNENEE
jgi:ribose-phosphate pyrophosphokinase